MNAIPNDQARLITMEGSTYCLSVVTSPGSEAAYAVWFEMLQSQCRHYFGGFGWPGFFTPVVSYPPLPIIQGRPRLKLILLCDCKAGEILNWPVPIDGELGTRLLSL